MNNANFQRWGFSAKCFSTLCFTVAFAALTAQAATHPRATAAHAQAASAAKPAATAQSTFASPQDALQALISAANTDDPRVMANLFGPDGNKLLSGDRVQDQEQLKRFATNLAASAQLQPKGSDYTVLVGDAHWPFPIPLVNQNGRWQFDTKSGIQEILDRRIGQDELSAIATCRAYAEAQWDYYTQSGAATNGLAVYAQKFVSTPGQRDGLYWPTAPGEQQSPLGQLVADARAEGYGARRVSARSSSEPPRPRPFHGYYFKILTAQGPSAPGGRFSYIINGNMIAGYALIAYPAKWGDSGVMTFIINNQGRVYQKNLGPDTAKIAAAMTEYNPDPTWQLVQQ